MTLRRRALSAAKKAAGKVVEHQAGLTATCNPGGRT
jgi:hypothetical protein